MSEEQKTNGALEKKQSREIRVVEDHGQFQNLLDTARFEHLYRLAQMFASSTLVPDSFRGNPANCFIGIQMALRCGVDPFMFLQKMYVVHGRPAIETQLAVAMANASGVFSKRIGYQLEGSGAARSCTARATIRDTGEIVEQTVSVEIAQAMGWWTKKDSLWPKMTDLMLQYRSAMWLIRTNCPEVLMGMMSKEEALEIGEETLRQPRNVQSLDDLTELIHRPEIAAQPAAVEVVETRQPGEDPPEQAGEPDWMQFDAELGEAAGTVAINKVGAAWKPLVDRRHWKRIDDCVEARLQQVKAARGAGSNKQQELV